jgi:hypothetical protein
LQSRPSDGSRRGGNPCQGFSVRFVSHTANAILHKSLDKHDGKCNLHQQTLATDGLTTNGPSQKFIAFILIIISKKLTNWWWPQIGQPKESCWFVLIFKLDQQNRNGVLSTPKNNFRFGLAHNNYNFFFTSSINRTMQHRHTSAIATTTNIRTS